MPTLMDLCGMEIPEECHGRSLGPLLAGKPGDYVAREAVFSENIIPEVITSGSLDFNFEPGKGIKGIRHPDAKMIRTERWKYNYYPEGFAELYDLENDPLEQENLAGEADHRATEAGRGCMAERWPIGLLRSRGFGLVTAYAGDLEPDHPEGGPEGVRGLFDDRGDWGAITAWAWGMSRILDHLGSDDALVDGDRVVALGHSRLGKTALWAAARDSRFAAAVSNDSGCLGAAISRRRFGATETEGRVVDVGVGQVAVRNGGHLRRASPAATFSRVHRIALQFRLGFRK